MGVGVGQVLGVGRFQQQQRVGRRLLPEEEGKGDPNNSNSNNSFSFSNNNINFNNSNRKDNSTRTGQTPQHQKVQPQGVWEDDLKNGKVMRNLKAFWMICRGESKFFFPY